MLRFAGCSRISLSLIQATAATATGLDIYSCIMIIFFYPVPPGGALEALKCGDGRKAAPEMRRQHFRDRPDHLRTVGAVAAEGARNAQGGGPSREVPGHPAGDHQWRITVSVLQGPRGASLKTPRAGRRQPGGLAASDFRPGRNGPPSDREIRRSAGPVRTPASRSPSDFLSGQRHSDRRPRAENRGGRSYGRE